MRILHITPDYSPAIGGGELYVKEVSERLAARGHEVSVLTLNSRGMRGRDGSALPVREVINAVNVTRLNATYRWHDRVLGTPGVHRLLSMTVDAERMAMLTVSPVSLRAFAQTLRFGADVVAVFNWYHLALAYQTASARAIRRFAFVGVPLSHTERPWAHSRLFGETLNRCDAVVCLTEHEVQFIQGRTACPTVRAIGAGVDPDSFSSADGDAVRCRYDLADAPLVGFVGRMAATKGVATLIRAMKLVWRSRPEARLLLAGAHTPATSDRDPDITRAWGELAKAEQGRVVCVERFGDSEKASIFAALDVFVMPSVAESFGIAYLEAWMCKKPVIGSRIGSTTCVIDEGVDGITVPPEDPESLSRGILDLLSDQHTRDRMGRAGHAKTIRSFTWERIADGLADVYESARRTEEARKRRDS